MFKAKQIEIVKVIFQWMVAYFRQLGRELTTMFNDMYEFLIVK